MKTSRAVTVIFLGATACAAPAPFTAAHRAAIVDSVQQVLTAWRDAFNARDFGRVATFYSGDSAFRWYENGELKFRSAKMLADTMRAEGSSFRALSLSLLDPEIVAVGPGVAEASTTFTEKVTEASGEIAGYAGAVSLLVVHGDSGWRFLRGHTSLVAPVVDTGRTAKGRRS